jgi:uncharacterized membrane protein
MPYSMYILIAFLFIVAVLGLALSIWYVVIGLLVAAWVAGFIIGVAKELEKERQRRL